MPRKERQQSGSVCNLHVRYESKTCPHDLVEVYLQEIGYSDKININRLRYSLYGTYIERFV